MLHVDILIICISYNQMVLQGVKIAEKNKTLALCFA